MQYRRFYRYILNNYQINDIYLIAGLILLVVGFLGRFVVIKASK